MQFNRHNPRPRRVLVILTSNQLRQLRAAHAETFKRDTQSPRKKAISMHEQRGHSSSVLVLVFVAGLILGAMVSAYALYIQIGKLRDDLSTIESQVSGISGQISGISGNQNTYNQNGPVYLNGTTAFSEIYGKVKDSVVLISGTIGSATDFGSGFIYNFTGSMVVVTNNHVVSGATDLSVTFSDGNGYAATVKGKDPYSDLAVLSVADASQIEFKPLEIVNSSSLKVGDPVIAIGNPLGLTSSMTTGIVSALGRSISEKEYAGGYAIANIIQTSAPINPGNSGGPLLNWDGNVVGITTAIALNPSTNLPTQGLGFAVPSNTIQKELFNLVESGNYTSHSYLGVSGTDMDYEIAKSMKTNVTYGWLIEQVVSGGPAQKAGLHGGTTQAQIEGTSVTIGGDIIVAINGTTVINGDEMTSYIEDRTLPNQTVILTVVRENQTLSLPLSLGLRPPPPA
jgi:S1-C subfamily serine protease